MPNLSTIAIEKQKHPGLSAENPFNVTWLYGAHPSEEFVGDMHYALQLGITLSGATEILYDGWSRICRPGECWWTMCWEPHACRIAAPRSFTVAINLEMNALGQCDPFGGCHWLLPFTLPPEMRYSPSTDAERALFLNTGRELFHLSAKRPNFWRQRSYLAINQLLLTAIEKLHDALPDAAGAAHNQGGIFVRLRPAIEMASRAGSKPVSLAKAAAACSFSASRFSELFRNAFGTSYGQFAARARLAQAAREIATSDLAVEEIAARWGYFDSSHFCHAFKKIYQCSPTEFRRRCDGAGTV